jgi:hypothetical protein
MLLLTEHPLQGAPIPPMSRYPEHWATAFQCHMGSSGGSPLAAHVGMRIPNGESRADGVAGYIPQIDGLLGPQHAGPTHRHIAMTSGMTGKLFFAGLGMYKIVQYGRSPAD